MHRKDIILIALLLSIPALRGFASAQQGTTAQAPSETHSGQKNSEGQPAALQETKLSVTRHVLTTATGELLRYTATAGFLRLVDGSDKPKADIFFVAYTAEESSESRPITFAFNGGPGASSIWLHMGVAGPVRVITGQDENPSAPPYNSAQNQFSWLPWTDLVFIDPVGTGFSRAIPADNNKQYFNTREDVHSVGDFIQLYTGRFGRWRSPKYLAGESYGGMRASELIPYVYERSGMEIAGLLLISPALDLNTIQPSASNDLPYVLYLPAYAAVARYHGKIASGPNTDLTATLSESEKWTIEEYLPALAKGNLLPDPEKERIAAKLSQLTGLPESLIKNRNLRISRPEFTSELLRSEGLGLSFMDGRITRRSRDNGFLNDPGMSQTVGPYTAILDEYVRDELGFTPGIPYVFFSGEANSQWEWGGLFSGDAVESLRKAMNRNKRLKILAVAGLFDLNVPYFATSYILSHLGDDPTIAGRVKVKYFPGGHMFYTNSQTLQDFTNDAAQFFKEQ